MPKWTREEQNAIRADIFRWLRERNPGRSLGFTREELVSYSFDGTRIPLVDQYGKGIRNPAEFEATLSITTSADKRRNPYSDEALEEGFILYDYRTGDGGDNIKLRRAAELQVPVIYFKQTIKAGPLVPVFPAYLRDDPANRRVEVVLDEVILLVADEARESEDLRRYTERTVRARLHQPMFRARVLAAYASAEAAAPEGRCAICELKHAELLDAAHIIRDGAPHSRPVVTNGIALCKIHHAAYDENFIGISPDYVVRVDAELLHEVDGPMLQHGLQEMEGKALILPDRASDRPNPDWLAERFTEFRAA